MSLKTIVETVTRGVMKFYTTVWHLQTFFLDVSQHSKLFILVLAQISSILCMHYDRFTVASSVTIAFSLSLVEGSWFEAVFL